MELHDLTALEQARAIGAREVSSAEFTEHYLARTHALNDTVGAFIPLTDELARQQAQAADRAVAESPDPATLSVLHGVVVPIKDLHHYQGVRVRFGSPVADSVASVDEVVAGRIRAAGTVMTGKTSTPCRRASATSCAGA